MLIDSHCHLQFPALKNNHPKIVQSMQDLHVTHAITVCTELAEIDDLKSIINAYPNIYASVGIHPNVKKEVVCDIVEIEKIINSHEKFIAIGECGLDFYYHKKEDVYAWQIERFNLQIDLALQMKLPLIVHSRESIPECIDALVPKVKQGLKAVIHCYTGNWEDAKRALDNGLYLSFTGVITYKKVKEIVEVAKLAPLDRIMIETDAPYLTPAPIYKKPNDPTNIPRILEFLAEVRNMDQNDLAKIIYKNTIDFFKIPK